MAEPKDADTEMVERHVRELGEHFDSVQILVSRHEPETEDGTISISNGSGNWFARYGQTREWLIKAEERTRDAVRGERD